MPTRAPSKNKPTVITVKSYVFAKKLLDDILQGNNIIKTAEIWVDDLQYVFVDVDNREAQ